MEIENSLWTEDLQMSKKGNKFNDAFQSDCQPCSGPPEKAVECVKEKITEGTIGAPDKSSYVGKSYDDGKDEGYRERYNSKYKQEGTTGMEKIYTTSSESNAYKMEKLAIAACKNNPAIANVAPGGNGRRTETRKKEYGLYYTSKK